MPPWSFSSQTIGMVYWRKRGSRMSNGSMAALPGLARLLLAGGRRALAPRGGIDRQADGDHQDAAVEEILDVEGGAELLHAGEGEGEDQDGEQGAGNVDPAGVDRGGAQQG